MNESSFKKNSLGGSKNTFMIKNLFILLSRPTKPRGVETDDTTSIIDNFLNCRMSDIPLDILVPYTVTRDR